MHEVLILSGAGLSAQSGLKTFRDSNGLWEEYDVMEVCSTQGFRKDRPKVLNFYNKRRAQLKDVEPNFAHKTIAQIKAKFGDKISVLTQNVDDLLERAGCEDVVHLHGELTKLRCEKCGSVFEVGYEAQTGKICPMCKSDKIRHHIVMFGELAPLYETLYQRLEEAKLFVCIGTSGEVLNVASYARMVGLSILNNLESSRIDPYFTKCYIEPATTAAPKIAKNIENFIRFGQI
ncbi:SIR2 family NAD-dependent protein deacylase [Campylobacter geochelonis]|uniref:protein acetyllysine N-acetyltransferase n=1 Tax=Campylobacter geochelonis TaxID=1780362 RepID=A0A128EDM1_9BACT|nr:Sir2 family NAD-dependent protein deacetylase [Campylobacter geochelonis]QKF70442.1 NAD-dependent protein deacetylase, SIR2 family [Campylobacter geochelonis]CZE46283.1 NAD-dependent deacetylase [Campylobacter geochelonis]